MSAKTSRRAPKKSAPTREPIVERPGHVEQWLFTTDLRPEGTWLRFFSLRSWLLGPTLELNHGGEIASLSRWQLRDIYLPSVVAEVQRQLRIAPEAGEKVIPLTSPAGAVVAWQCAVCLHVGATGQMGAGTARVEEFAERSRQEADDCCRCDRCRAVMPDLRRRGVCDACQPAEAAERAAREAEHQAWAERRRIVHEATIACAKDARAAEHLRREMRDLSEQHYAAGWLSGLEFDLWAMVLGGKLWSSTATPMTEASIALLRRLSEEAGGWWRHVEEVGDVFVPAEEWARLYEERTADR